MARIMKWGDGIEQMGRNRRSRALTAWVVPQAAIIIYRPMPSFAPLDWWLSLFPVDDTYHKPSRTYLSLRLV